MRLVFKYFTDKLVVEYIQPSKLTRGRRHLTHSFAEGHA